MHTNKLWRSYIFNMECRRTKFLRPYIACTTTLNSGMRLMAFFNIMTYGDRTAAPFQHFLWYNDTRSSCLSGNRDIQSDWLRMGLFNSKQSSQLALWYAAKGNLDEGRFSPIASVITGFVLLIVCLILFIPLPCLIIVIFKNNLKFRRLRRKIETFLTTCFTRKIVDEKFVATDYKLLMQKLKANRPEISVVGKRVPSRKTKLLPVDDTTKKPDIPATAFGGSVKFPIPTAAQLFTKTKKKPPKKGKSKHKTLTDEDLKSKDKLQPAQAKESVVPISSTAQSGTTTTVDDFVVAYNKDDAKSNIMHESGIHNTGQPFQLADEVSAIDYDSGASKPQTPNSTTASTAPSEVKKPTTSVDKKVKEQKPEKDGKKESKDTKKRKKMYPFDLSDTQKE
ncbi:hypothetical protein M3Y94_01212000 [Aphelenchoides besseyi]|nr:hypothetical protein M3Y94_01212000 [Aphelenchoides besseyi]